MRSNIRSSLRNRPAAGAMVLDAVRRNELYLSTHPYLLAPIAERHARIQAGFPE